MVRVKVRARARARGAKARAAAVITCCCASVHEFCSVSGSSSTHAEAAVTQAVWQSYRLVELAYA